MRNPPHHHPDEETLESHAMGKLSGVSLSRIERHLLTCADCQHRLKELDVFLAAMREAAAGLLESVGHTHATSDGPVRLVATKLPNRRWLARFQGRELQGQYTFDSLPQASDFLRRSFAEMYPEHSCTPQCRRDE